MPVIKNIFIFGDSITYGEWDQSGGWANRIRSHYDNLVLPVPDDYIITYNLGIPSDTSQGLAQRIVQETQSRLVPNPGVNNIKFIIAIGANDARWLVNEQRRGDELGQFKTNLEKITAAANSFSSNILYVGLLPCDEQTVLQAAKKHQWVEIYDNEALLQYNEVIKQHCLQTGHEFVDVYDAFVNNSHESLLSDGLHPNASGHAMIFDLIIDQLKSLS